MPDPSLFNGKDNLNPLQWAQIARAAESLKDVRAVVKRHLSELIHVNSLLITIGMRSATERLGRKAPSTSFQESAGVLVDREWTEFLSAGNFASDPMVKRLGNTHRSLFWWENSPLHRSMDDNDRRFARHYFEHDIRLGIVDGYAGRPGEVSELIALDSRASSREFREFTSVYGHRFQLATAWLWEGIRLKALEGSPDALRLAPRELECLAWASTGMTSHDIAQRLSLSVTTVDEYIASAMRRLGAQTRVQACARATLLGLISP
jgi:DNA-binding CsgD family transcriptional regulator